MRVQLFTFMFAIVTILSSNFAAAQEKSLPRSTPEAEGVSSEKLLAFLKAADEKVDSMHSFMLVRNGKVVSEAWWEPEAADKPHVLWSLSKSFTSTAVGFAVTEGKLKIDEPVSKFFPESMPENPSDNLKAMQVKDLLTMAAGHQNEVFLRNEKDWPKAFLAHPVPHKPGTHFQYNTPATFMQAAIVEKLSGENLVDYLQPRLFEPLGIEKPTWDKNPAGITLGGYGLYLKTEDIAKFGQLYLQKGKWNGKQIITPEWIELATSKQVANGSNPDSDWNQGYGFQFWRCRHNAFRGDGKDGQFCIVIPDQNAVIAITANTGNMQAELNVVWDYLLPALSDKPLPENPNGVAAIKAFTAELKAKK